MAHIRTIIEENFANQNYSSRAQFLQNLIKPYRQMREELTQLLQQSALDSEVTDKPVVANAGYRLIYVSLYYIREHEEKEYVLTNNSKLCSKFVRHQKKEFFSKRFFRKNNLKV